MSQGPIAGDRADFPVLRRARESWAANRLDEALVLFDRALRERPGNVKAMLEAARAFGLRHEVGRAEAILQRAEELAGDDPLVAPVIAASYRQVFRPGKAVELFERVRTRMGSLGPAHLAELAILYEQTNQVEQAWEAIEASVEKAPSAPEPLLVKARLARRRGDHGTAERLLIGLTERVGAPPMLYVQSWGELCQVRDRAGDYDGALGAIEHAKAILRALPQAQHLLRQAHLNNQVLGAVYESLDRATVASWTGATPPSDPRCSGIAHLVGFPRSGTTLLEQVLGAHPGLVDSPERVVFSRDIFRAMYAHGGALSLDSLRTIPPGVLLAQRRRYLDYMEAAQGEPLGGRVHMDKNPNHTSLIVGLLRLFPESRFIVSLRDPRDVLVSCYLRVFNLTEVSACFLTWEGAAMIYAFEMGVWLRLREVLQGSWIEVRYEDTVADLGLQARRALEFLGLPWDEGVLSYLEQGRRKVVNSPTHEAVREPVYTRSIGRWRHYEPHIRAHAPGLDRFLRAFGYA